MLKFLHESTTEGGTLYPPNTNMSDFKRQMIIFVHNFVPSNDESISPNWFFMLGKMGKPNQVSWMMPFLVLGKCTCRYSLSKFDDVDSAVRFNINRTILSNHSMLFGGKWQAHWQHCILQQTFMKNFMRGFAPRFWKRVATTASLLLENMPGTHAGSGSLRGRFSINGILHMKVVLGETRDSFFIHIGCWCCISFR